MVDVQRLQALGTQLIAAVAQPGWKVESRATHAATRLPLARHQHTGRFGELILDDLQISIDQDPAGALIELYDTYRENLITKLPLLSPSLQPATTSTPVRNGDGISITRYNQNHDVEDVFQLYGARSGRRRGLYFCPFHEDEHASLQVYTADGRRYVHCLSAHSDCPLASHGRNDAFNVYCIGEGLDAKAALRQLNRKG